MIKCKIPIYSSTKIRINHEQKENRTGFNIQFGYYAEKIDKLAKINIHLCYVFEFQYFIAYSDYFFNISFIFSLYCVKKDMKMNNNITQIYEVVICCFATHYQS